MLQKAAGKYSRARRRPEMPTASASETALALLKQCPAALLFTEDVCQTSGNK